MKRFLSLILILSLVATSAIAQVIRRPSPQEADPIYSAWDKDYGDMINTPDLSLYAQKTQALMLDQSIYEQTITGTLTGTGNTTLGTIKTVSAPTSGTMSFNYGSGNFYTAYGFTFVWRVYSYKMVDGVKIYSSSYIDIEDVDDASERLFTISVSWDAVADADGYKITGYEDFSGMYGDWYYETTSTSVIISDPLGFSGTPSPEFINQSPLVVTPTSTKTFHQFNGDTGVLGNLAVGRMPFTDAYATKFMVYGNDVNSVVYSLRNGDDTTNESYRLIFGVGGSNGHGYSDWVNAGFMESGSSNGFMLGAYRGSLKLGQGASRTPTLTINHQASAFAGTVTTTGNVGIGMTNPPHKLDVYGVTGNTVLGVGDVSGSSSKATIYLQADADSGTTLFNSRFNHPFGIATNNTLRMTVKNTGEVGIGTQTPLGMFEVQGGLTTDGAVLTLGTKEPTVVAKDVLGRVNFYAPLEGSGGDSLLTGASVVAIAEDTFTGTVNKTSLLFQTGASETATTKMILTSGGNLKLQGDNFKSYWGTADDASMYYDGTNLIINPKDAGTGYVSVLGDIVASNLSGTNTGNQVGDGTTITGSGTVADPFVAVGGGGGSQTPWTGDIDGAVYDLTNVKDIDAQDISAEEVFSGEYVANADFETDSLFTTNNGTVTWSDGSYTFFASAIKRQAFADMVITPSEGVKRYKYEFYVSAFSGGSVIFYPIYPGSFSVEVTATGLYSGEAEMEITDPFKFGSGGSGDSQVTIDYISIKEITKGDITAEHKMYADAFVTQGGSSSDFVKGNGTLQSATFFNIDQTTSQQITNGRPDFVGGITVGNSTGIKFSSGGVESNIIYDGINLKVYSGMETAGSTYDLGTEVNPWGYVRANYFVGDGSNLTGVAPDLSGKTTDDINQGSTNLYFGAGSLDTIADGSSYTRQMIADGATAYGWGDWSGQGFITDLNSFTTDNLTEGSTNLYFNDTNANNWLSGKSPYTGDLNDSTNTKIADVVDGLITAVYY